MKVLVTGSRDIDRQSLVSGVISDAPWKPDEIIHGGATGVDQKAVHYALRNDIDEQSHPVPTWVWEMIGAKAGPMRNGYMVERSDAVIAIWGEESPGTKDTIKQAEAEGLPIYKVTCHVTGDGWVIKDESLVEDDQTSLNEFEVEANE